MAERTTFPATVRGLLHIDVAYDWGDEIDLAAAAKLAPSEAQGLARRPRTPASFAYHPAPQRFPLPSISLELPGHGTVVGEAEATVFDFGGANVGVTVALEATPEAWCRVASDPQMAAMVIGRTKAAAEPLYQRLLPAIHDARWHDISEEYFTFQFDPSELPMPDALLAGHADWLAGLLRLEIGPLSSEEIVEALRRQIRYSPSDLVIIDWAAAVVIDKDCEETLRTIEFANLQLLEFRHLDRRLDDSLERAYGMLHTSSRMPGARRASPGKSLRALGDLRIETEVMFERTGNAFQLVGDQYLARLYRLLAARFHLDEWGKSIRQTLDAVEDVYQILADQASAHRIEIMELIVIVLIAVEIILSLMMHR